MIPLSIKQLDIDDPLSAKRELFALPEEKIYLNGNSLGPLPVAVRARMQSVIDYQWGEGLVKSWNQHQWIDLPIAVGNKIAPLIGANTGEVICCDSVSVNLFKLLSSAISFKRQRSDAEKMIVLSQQDNFPTDLYIAEGLSDLLGHDSVELITVAENEIEQALDKGADVLLLTQVNFRSGKLHDIEAITKAARDRDCLVIWDLSHSVGVLPLHMKQWQVDLAVGCGYKYLNGGPGAPAFIYMSASFQKEARQPLQGWMGHRTPFEFTANYIPDDGINRMQSGTPAILSMSALDAALDCFADINMDQLHQKASKLSEVFLESLNAHGKPEPLHISSPLDPKQRGAQLGLSHENAYAISQALDAQGIVSDFRRPDILRMGFSPLFLRFADVWRAGAVLVSIINDKTYTDQQFRQKNKVT